MSVDLLIKHKNQKETELFPISARGSYTHDWEPLIHELDLKLLTEASMGLLEILPHFDDFLNELYTLKNHVVLLLKPHPDDIHLLNTLSKCDRLIQFLEEIRPYLDTVEYISFLS